MKTLKVLLGLAALSVVASASIVLDISDGNGTGPFGTVDLSQVNSSTVHVLVTASGTYEFVDTGSHDTFGFDLFNSTVVNPNISITNLSSGFYVGSGFSNGFAGTYVYSVGCVGPTTTKPPDACASGASSPALGPFSFDVHISSGTLLITDFTANAKGYAFAADVYGPSAAGGNFTGLVENGSPVPEPVTSALVGTGLIALFFVRRRVRS